LLVSDSGGNISTINLNNLIEELEGKMVQIKNGAKKDKGDPGANGNIGPQGIPGPPGPAGSNADCVKYDTGNQFYNRADHWSIAHHDGRNSHWRMSDNMGDNS
jgi:hypothetical protein